ncbi:4Fe-4S binding protein [Clostridium rectalis]|uniref:4Fe-4S binding protein n=1 Tax=Clostridium rectalis TaxID=2040295 RepID=UPI000F631793|nr:4Fe-4S binding protein [Clostridium rectalis]
MKGSLKLWKKYAYIVLLIFIFAGMFDMRIALLATLCMIGPLVLALFGKGRFWCGNVCPRGSFYDNILAKISPKKQVPKFLKSNVFRLAVIIVMFYMFGTGIYKNWGNAYGIGMVFYRMIVITTLVGIVLGVFINGRTWCSFCPMGSIAAFITYFKKNTKTLAVSDSCVSCKLCEKKCSMGIVPYEYKGNALDNPDCIQCGQCITVCPKDAIK